MDFFLLEGVETVKAESDAGKVTVTGKVDPTKVRDNLAEKIRKKVELVSPQPKKEKENEKDPKPNNKSENKTQDKKTKDKEVHHWSPTLTPFFLILFISLSLPLPTWVGLFIYLFSNCVLLTSVNFFYNLFVSYC